MSDIVITVKTSTNAQAVIVPAQAATYRVFKKLAGQSPTLYRAHLPTTV